MLGLLLLGAVAGQCMAGEGVDADAEADGEAGGGEFFEDLKVDLVRLVSPAVLGVVRKAEQSGLGQKEKTSRGKCPESSSSAARGAISRWMMSRTRAIRSLDSSVGS